MFIAPYNFNHIAQETMANFSIRNGFTFDANKNQTAQTKVEFVADERIHSQSKNRMHPAERQVGRDEIAQGKTSNNAQRTLYCPNHEKFLR